MKNWLTLKDPQAEKLVLDLGLAPGGKEYTRFLILGRSRTGSNFLRGLLKEHPQIETMGEILRNQHAIDWDNPKYRSTAKVLRQYQHDPVGFMEGTVFRNFSDQIKAVGFKLFYYHANKDPQKIIWDYLKENKQMHIIHIKRKNILRTHLSRKRAVQSGSWVNTDGTRENHKKIALDVEECRQDFEQTRDWETTYDRFFQFHPKIDIFYEELAENYQPIIEKTQKFLGLPIKAVSPQTYKQSSKPLSEEILNYFELKEQFQATQWSEFFDE